jgi:hypothetical protein
MKGRHPQNIRNPTPTSSFDQSAATWGNHAADSALRQSAGESAHLLPRAENAVGPMKPMPSALSTLDFGVGCHWLRQCFAWLHGTNPALAEPDGMKRPSPLNVELGW